MVYWDLCKVSLQVHLNSAAKFFSIKNNGDSFKVQSSAFFISVGVKPTTIKYFIIAQISILSISHETSQLLCFSQPQYTSNLKCIGNFTICHLVDLTDASWVFVPTNLFTSWNSFLSLLSSTSFNKSIDIFSYPVAFHFLSEFFYIFLPNFKNLSLVCNKVLFSVFYTKYSDSIILLPFKLFHLLTY